MIPDFERITSACPRQWLYLLGEEGVVYSEAKNRFAGLDAAGVSAYLAFDAGAQIDDLKRLGGGDRAGPASGAVEAIYALSQGVFPGEDASADWPVIEPSQIAPSGAANIEIDGIPILLEFLAGQLEDLCRDYFRNCLPSTRPARFRLSAQRKESGWAICVNGREFFSSQQERQLGLGLMHAARSLLYAEGTYDVAFHAAMVSQGDCGVLLCAPREYGKSTLAAYLVAQGFDLLTDEPALLHLATLSVSRLRLPISVKEGSWPILRPHWPQLDAAPVHLRSDGQKIRLLHPLHERRSQGPGHLARIVFPRYRPAAPAQVETVSPLHMLRMLNEGGMVLAKHFARAGFEAFLNSIFLTPGYKLQYASLEDASRILADLL
ncbi:MAG: hypothetical protein WBE76_02770 [Terracidiphilus sp.]